MPTVPGDTSVCWQVKVLGEMNKNLRSLGKFAFHFTTAIYLLAVPATLLFKGGDWMLPYEAGFCTFLSTINGGLAAKHAWRALK